MSSPTVVLVHGGFVDGSGWRGVHDALTADGYRTVVVQNPTLSGNAAATRWVLDSIDGPVVLVGHSYGGAVISEAGTHPAVSALVYITAFAPDAGESVQTLTSNPAPGAPVPPIVPPREGFLLLDESKFYGSFAADLPPEQGRFLASSQVPWGVDAYASAVTEPASGPAKSPRKRSAAGSATTSTATTRPGSTTTGGCTTCSPGSKPSASRLRSRPALAAARPHPARLTRTVWVPPASPVGGTPISRRPPSSRPNVETSPAQRPVPGQEPALLVLVQ